MSKTNTFKGYFSGFITVMIFILSFLGMSRLAQAKSIDWGTTSVFFHWDHDLGEEQVTLPISRKSVMVEVSITNVYIYDDFEHKPVDVKMFVRAREVYGDKEDIDIYTVRSGESLTFTSWFGEDRDMIDFELEYIQNTDLNTDFCNISFDITIKKLYDAELNVSCDKSVTLKDDGDKKIYIDAIYGYEDDIDGLYFIKAKSSNKNIILVCADDNYIEIFGMEKPGKCKIYVTVKYKGETCNFTIDVTVKSNLKSVLTAIGGLDYYYTRDNYFIMKVKNRSKKSITIYSDGAYALNYNYKSFDRRVRLSGGKSKIVIKPGKSKRIKWKVIGSVTWYNAKDFEIYSKWKYSGKTKWVWAAYNCFKVFNSGKWRRIDY